MEVEKTRKIVNYIGVIVVHQYNETNRHEFVWWTKVFD